MKKLSFALALILACGMLASCGDDSGTTTKAPEKDDTKTTAPADNKTDAPDPGNPTTPSGDDGDTTTAEKGGDTTPQPSEGGEPTGGEDAPKEELIDASRFTLDGDLSDWEGLHTMKLQGEATTAHKSVTFYGAMTTEGLYLACDIYHDMYKFGDNASWWMNTNFEMFIDAEINQVYAYAAGIGADCLTGKRPEGDAQITEAVMVTTEINDGAKYHTIAELFISNDDLPEDVIFDNTVSVGLACKTASDLIIGGQYHVGDDGSDDWWAVRGEDADGAYNVTNCPMVATPSGLYWFEDYAE